MVPATNDGEKAKAESTIQSLKGQVRRLQGLQEDAERELLSKTHRINMLERHTRVPLAMPCARRHYPTFEQPDGHDNAFWFFTGSIATVLFGVFITALASCS